MTDLDELYQEVILDHTRRPRNFGSLKGANCRAEGVNPLCGDHVTLQLQVENGIVRDARFQGNGCAISTASASLMTQAIKGKPTDEVVRLFERFHQALTSSLEGESDLEGLGKLAVLTGVREFPLRVKCASLAWHTLKSALEGRSEPVTTE
ncbi:MAG: Fe-S cluster assembly sulfur transfer protein SufU [Myxococcota bacterium]